MLLSGGGKGGGSLSIRGTATAVFASGGEEEGCLNQEAEESCFRRK